MLPLSSDVLKFENSIKCILHFAHTVIVVCVELCIDAEEKVLKNVVLALATAS